MQQISYYTRSPRATRRYWHSSDVKPEGLRPSGFTSLLCGPRALRHYCANICRVALEPV